MSFNGKVNDYKHLKPKVQNGHSNGTKEKSLANRTRMFSREEAKAFISSIALFMDKCESFTSIEFSQKALEAETKAIEAAGIQEDTALSSRDLKRGRILELLGPEEKETYIGFLYTLASHYSHLVEPDLPSAEGILAQITIREKEDWLSQMELSIIRLIKSFTQKGLPASDNFSNDVVERFAFARKTLEEKNPELGETEKMLVWEGAVFNALTQTGRLPQNTSKEELYNILKGVFENSASFKAENAKDFFREKVYRILDFLMERKIPLSVIAHVFGQSHFEAELQIEDLGPLRTFMFIQSFYTEFKSIDEIYAACGGKNNPEVARRGMNYYLHLKIDGLRKLEGEQTSQESLFNLLMPLFICSRELMADKEYWNLLGHLLRVLIEQDFFLSKISHAFCRKTEGEREIERTEIRELRNVPARLSLITLLLAGKRDAEKVFVPLKDLKNNLGEKEAVLYMIGRINWIMTDNKIQDPAKAAQDEINGARKEKLITDRECSNLKTYKKDLVEKNRKRKEVFKSLAELKSGEIRNLPAAVGKILNAFAGMPELEDAMAGKIPAIIREMLAAGKVKEAAYFSAELLKARFPAGEEIKEIFAEAIQEEGKKGAIEKILVDCLKKPTPECQKLTLTETWREEGRSPRIIAQNLAAVLPQFKTETGTTETVAFDFFMLNFPEDPLTRKVIKTLHIEYAEPVCFESLRLEMLAGAIKTDPAKKIAYLKKAAEADPRQSSACFELVHQLYLQAKNLIVTNLDKSAEERGRIVEKAEIIMEEAEATLGKMLENPANLLVKMRSQCRKILNYSMESEILTYLNYPPGFMEKKLSLAKACRLEMEKTCLEILQTGTEEEKAFAREDWLNTQKVFAFMHILTHDFKAAGECYEIVLQSRPEDAKSLLDKGMLFFFRGDFFGAQKYFTRVTMALQKKQMEFFSLYAEASYQCGFLAAAENIAKTMTEKVAIPNFLLLLGRIALLEKDLSKAAQLLKKAREAFEMFKRQSPNQLKTICYTNITGMAELLEAGILDSQAETDPNLINRAKKQYQKAIAEFSREPDLHFMEIRYQEMLARAEYVDALNRWADATKDKSFYTLAEEEGKKLVEKYPFFTPGRRVLIVSFLSQDKDLEALQHFEYIVKQTEKPEDLHQSTFSNLLTFTTTENLLLRQKALALLNEIAAKISSADLSIFCQIARNQIRERKEKIGSIDLPPETIAFLERYFAPTES